VKPCGHVQVPEAEHIPALEHGGEHAEDWMSSNAILDNSDPEGSCDRSGAESHRMRRSVDDAPEETATHTLDASMTEPAEVDVESLDALFVGKAVNVAGPE
jgi:hypothetical protein